MPELYPDLCRGEALYVDIDRDVNFENKTITVSGAVSFFNGNQPEETEGKTSSARRIIPLVDPLAIALNGNHGLVCPKEDRSPMSQTAFNRKYESYIQFLETKLNGCPKYWYGRKKEHKKLLAEGKTLLPWKDVTVRCHDFRVIFCTRYYYAGIPLKTFQAWMGHSDVQMEVLLSRGNYFF